MELAPGHKKRPRDVRVQKKEFRWGEINEIRQTYLVQSSTYRKAEKIYQEGQKRKETDRKKKRKKWNVTKHPLRAQVESQGDMVAVCCYDQSCDTATRYVVCLVMVDMPTDDDTKVPDRWQVERAKTKRSQQTYIIGILHTEVCVIYSCSYVQLVGPRDDTRDPKEGRNEGLKTVDNV